MLAAQVEEKNGVTEHDKMTLMPLEKKASYKPTPALPTSSDTVLYGGAR